MLSVSRNDDMKMKLYYRRKLFSKATLSSSWNAKVDVYNQLLNRVAEDTKIGHGKTFIPTNNYDLFYLKQRKSNPSLSLTSLTSSQIIQTG